MHEADRFGSDGCVPSETLARFVDGMLDAQERADVIRHLARCERCRETVAMASDAASHAAAPVAPAARGIRRGTVAVLALAASIVIAVTAYLLPTLRSSPYRELLTAAGNVRPVDGRIAGLPYAVPSATRGAATTTGNWQLLAAAARAKSAAAAERNETTLHALGVAHLLLGEYDEAVRALDEAAHKTSTASIESDLAAAYTARAVQRQVAGDFAQALAAAERAISADPGLNEAYFNRALALEGLAMEAEAAAAWQTYLQRDPSGPWAAEARERLARHRRARVAPFPAARESLDAALVSGDTAALDALIGNYPQATRDYFVDEVLRQWADAAESGDSAAEARLETARRLAAAFARRGNDRAPAEMLARIDASTGHTDRRELAVLHRTYSDGKRLQAADRLNDAAAVFERCAATDGHAHPLALECAYHTTAPALNAGGGDAARVRLLAVTTAAEAQGYHTLAGMARWRLALVSGTDGDLTNALAEYQRALAHFDRAGVADLSANVHSLMSEVLRILGDIDGAWQQHRAALDASRQLWSPRIRHQILVQAVLTSLATGLPEVALDLTDTLIAEDRAWQHQPSLALAYAHRARALSQLARQSDALAALADARRIVATVPDADYQRRFDTELMSARLEVIGKTNPGDSLATADAVLDNVRYASATVRIPGFLFSRGLAHASLGQPDLAERDYVDALGQIESEHDRIAADSLRVSHLQRNFEVVRTLVDFLLSVRHDDERALATLEQSRARWLLASIRGASARPSLPQATIAALPADTAVLYYGVLDSGIHAWLLTDRGLTHHALTVSPAALDEAVRALWTRLQDDTGDDRALLIQLDDWLIAPLRDDIGARTRLIVVPDGSIYNVPLSALIDRDSNRYLVDRVTVIVSPSLTLAPLQPGSATALPPVPSVGIFGSNVTGRPVLHELSAEQDTIAALYPSPSTARYHGDKREFLTNLDRHDIVHFAGHATANLADPALSRLEFPSNDALPTGDVLAGEITALHLHRVRVVVLAACRTGWGANVAGEGTLSLAHAFLGAGAGAVLGSLWDVDDRATRTLLTWMYEEMARGQSLADALRTAQRRALASPDPDLKRPSRWAAFVASVRS